jgi:hypothetical protein
MDTIMIALIAVVSFLAGAHLTIIAAVLYHKERVRVMKRDALAALMDQAADSWYSGYMRALREENTIRIHKERSTTETQKILITL